MDNKTCAGCFYGGVVYTNEGTLAMGNRICRRYPPVLQIVPMPPPRNADLQALYPVVKAQEWCGEYKAREDALLPGEQALEPEAEPE